MKPQSTPDVTDVVETPNGGSLHPVVMPFFRVILSRHESNPDWQIVSNPRWDYFTKAQSAILENFANDYAEYKNCGCMSRMVRVQDLKNYGLKITDESWALDPRHNAEVSASGVKNPKP